MDSFQVKTSKKAEVLDITAEVSRRLKPGSLCTLFIPHTTAALTINEFEPNIKEDFERFYSSLVKGRDWKHNSVDANAEAHLLSSIIKPSISIPIHNGSLALGTWQKILFIELDGPRTRTVNMQVIK
jgi:secondary thiamine-phosphate synthase enzyme